MATRIKTAGQEDEPEEANGFSLGLCK